MDLLDDQFQPEQVRPARALQTIIPRVVDVRGIALDKITDFKQLDPREPAVAIIDDVIQRKQTHFEIKIKYFRLFFRIYVLIVENVIWLVMIPVIKL